MRTGPTNQNLVAMLATLRKESITGKSPLWKRVAEDLNAPTRQRCEVNLSRLNRFTTDNDVIIVPGKVLGTGNLDHKLTIAALSFSGGATTRIREAKGTILTIPDLMKKHPDGKNIRVIG